MISRSRSDRLASEPGKRSGLEAPAGVQGVVEPGFKGVKRQFLKILKREPRGGGALCIYHHGRCVVDLQGGVRNAAFEPWAPETLVLSYSTGKGVLASLLHILVDQGVLDYEDRVSDHWPDFAQNGKESITVRHLLCHEAGLYRIGDLVESAGDMLDWDRMVSLLARSEPVHPPGADHGYHGLSYGWLIGELLQRATGWPLDRLVCRYISDPLGLNDFFFGLPPSEDARRADLVSGRVDPNSVETSRLAMRLGLSGSSAVHASQSKDDLRAALWPQGMENFDLNAPALRRAVMPSFNGMFTARGLARLYSALAEGGALDGVRLLSPSAIGRATEIQNQGPGRVLPQPMDWRLGYHGIPSARGDGEAAFGHFGLGGSGALADPRRRLSLAFVINTGVTGSLVDSRMIRLMQSAFQSVDRMERHECDLSGRHLPELESTG
ncbi:MAG: hypothetical protein CBC48_00365 [bacterium TMED88]|nr:hypothetical protein [Deltaproteobacteria bacterium]OUV37532.1 MAG: hypothetical protein CBC48_00365 [bacterium TMED88]